MTNHIGQNIRSLRKKQNWSQEKVAKGLEISIPAYSKIETGITDINIDRLHQVAAFFNVSVVDILIDELAGSKSQEQGMITELKTKLAKREEEYIQLQAKIIDLYEKLKKI